MANPAGYDYYRVISALTNLVSRVDLTAFNFDFNLCKPDGSDLLVYDETVDAAVPFWLRDFDVVARTGRLWLKASNLTHEHRIYYGNNSASSTSGFAGVFTKGTGFDADWGDLATATAGTNAQCDRVPAATGWSDPRQRRIWRRMKDAQIRGDVNGPNYIGVRDLSITTDRYGQIVEDTPGTWVAYYGNEATPGNGLSRRTMRCVSADRGLTWTNHTQVLMPDQTYDSLGAMVDCVIKISSNLYYMWYTATGTSADTPHTGGVALATSTDNVTWTKQGVVIPSTTTQIVDYVCASVAVPRVKVMRDGKWTMFCESRPAGSNFKVVGFTATSPDGPWTVMNSGHVIQGGDAGIWWGTDGFANPYVDELDDGSGYLLFTNGAVGHTLTTDYNWQSAFMTASAYSGPYTADAKSPPFGRQSGWYGVETSVLAIDAVTRERIIFIDDFGTSATVDNEPSTFRTWPITDRGGLMATHATTEAALAGMALAAGTFTAESVNWMTAHRSEDSAPYILSVMDTAALPTPDTSTNIVALNILRLTIRRTTFANASPGDIQFLYYDASNVGHVWQGAAWATSGTSTAATSDPNRPIRASISDDGTNFLFKASYDDDDTVLASASIAKSSVHSFANPRFLVVGDPFTNAYAGGTFYRQVSVRPYVASEPALMVGGQVSLGVVIPPPPVILPGGSLRNSIRRPASDSPSPSVLRRRNRVRRD